MSSRQRWTHRLALAVVVVTLALPVMMGSLTTTLGAGMAFRNPWRARSWDRFAVPLPFRAACAVAPEPVVVPPDADRDDLESYRLEVERRMNTATDEAEHWVKRL